MRSVVIDDRGEVAAWDVRLEAIIDNAVTIHVILLNR